MTATNHALTGTAIGLFVASPAIALPAAFLSHFVLDALPHFGAKDKQKALRSSGFKKYLAIEAAICFMIVVILAVLRPVHWQIAAFCAFLAASPDLYWIGKYRAALRGEQYSKNWFSTFASKIQWFEKPIGAAVEIVWFIALMSLLVPVIKTLAKS